MGLKESGSLKISGGILTGSDWEKTSTTFSNTNTWTSPERLSVEEVGDTIEMVFKETSTLTYLVYPSRASEQRVFKIVYSCVDGKWNKSERIYGEIVPAQEEYYEFQ